MITRLATQGRQGSDEYVTEFTFGFSDDKQTWRYYTDEWGNTMVSDFQDCQSAWLGSNRNPFPKSEVQITTHQNRIKFWTSDLQGEI